MTAPLVVNTKGGACWTRREETRGGEALYAPEKCGSCPAFVMATLPELAELGIVGSADALPMPVGPQSQALSPEREREIRSLDLLALMGDRVAPVISGHLAALLAEIDQLRAQRERRRLRLIALQNDALNMRGELSPMGEDRKVPFPLGETLTPAVAWLIARVAELEAERHSTNEWVDDAAKALRARRVLDPAEYGRVWSLVPDRTDRERVDAVLASIGLLAPPPPSEPGTCVAWSWDGSGWWQCVESADHDPSEGHGNGEGLSWADGVEYAEPACPCPPADQPGPHQLGCPQAEVPSPERPVNELAAVYMPVAVLREDVSPQVEKLRALLAGQRGAIEDPHDSPLHHEYRVPHDLPEGCRFSEEQVRELGNPFLGGGA